jgi:hypothetical protein
MAGELLDGGGRRPCAEQARHEEMAQVVKAPALASLQRAQIAFVRGEEEQSATELRAAIQSLSRLEMHGFAAVARRALGKMVKGDEGGGLVREGEAFLRAQTVKDIPALCRSLSPGFQTLG